MTRIVQKYMFRTVYGPGSTEIYVQYCIWPGEYKNICTVLYMVQDSTDIYVQYCMVRVVQKYMYSTVYGPGRTEIYVQYCIWPG